MKLFCISCFHAAWTSLELHWQCEPLSRVPRTAASDVSLAHSELTQEPRPLWETLHLPLPVCMLSSELGCLTVSRVRTWRGI